MGKETDESIPTVSESKLLEEAGPNREPLKKLDARDLNVETETLPDQNDVQTNGHSDLDNSTQQKSDKNENDLVALDGDEIEDGIDETPAKEETSVTAKILVAALIVLMISGVFIYAKPSLTGIKEKVEPVPEAKSQTREPVEPAQIQTPKPKPPGKYDKYLAKLEEADRLREELLEKKEEIYKLKLHYRNGIAELMDQVGQEIQETGISSYAQALENKRIELILRTIQRRQIYIKELEKPDRWLHNGSEELLFLKRKAQLDFQMVDIAGGIDLNRHLRYINAAIQQYQPSAEKLAVAPPPADSRPLETIWNEINNQQMNKAATALGHKDGNIIEEICSGNFKHITELSVITTMAARCLSKNSGSDLFLNGLTQLSPDEARYLFQWQGNWICLNSVKKLAPAAAKYLFEWEGNWISLNGLTEFPPELALYLMEWRGSQLELMGLSYDKKKPDPRALKYLALWETMGGKLFVSEGIRKEMRRVM